MLTRRERSGLTFELIFAGLVMLFFAAPVFATTATVKETISQGRERQSVAVTIYNQSLALVREERELDLTKGLNRIALRDVSAKIRPETASLRSLDGKKLTLLEQNFDFDLLSPHSLLEKFVGETITVITFNESRGKETKEQATVLAINDGVVLRFADRIESELPSNARIVYDKVPPNLRDRPTLVLDLKAEHDGRQRVDLSYLTSGFSWQADYVATLADDEASLDLSAWVSLTNDSGTSFEDAKLQLVAGDVNLVQPQLHARKMYTPAAESVQDEALMEQENLFEYNLYTLQRPTNLKDNQTKQVALLSASGIPVRKEYRLQGAESWYYQLRSARSSEQGDKRKVDVFIEFDNKDGGLGQALPKGVVRVYKNDAAQRALFVGEDQIDHTAKNERVRLKLGSAFDINANWKNRYNRKIADNVYKMAFDIELRNAKNTPVTVRVLEPIPGNWTVVKESHPSTKPGAHLAMWDVEVPAEGKQVLSYEIRVTF